MVFSWSLTIFRAFLLTLFLAGGAGTALNHWRLLRSPLTFDFGEGIVLWQAQHILERDKTYRSIDTPPYNVTHYPPLYHFAVRAMVGENGDWLYTGRLLSFMSGMGMVLVLGATTFFLLPARTKAWDKITAAVVSGCSLFLDNSSDWMRIARVDFMGLTLMFCGLAILCIGRKRLLWELSGLTLLIAAGFTKHVFFTVLAACLLAQLLIDYRRLAIWGAWIVAVAAVPLLYFQSVTNGGFLMNLLGYNQNPYLFSTLSRHLRGVLFYHAMLIAFGVPFLIYGMVWLARRLKLSGSLWRQKVNRSNFRWYILALAIHLLIAGVWLIAMGKVGSGPNYALPFLLTINLGAGLTTWYVLFHWRASTSTATYPPACLAVMIALTLIPEARMLVRAPVSVLNEQELQERQRLISTLKAEKGPIYSEDMVVLLQAGHEVLAEPAIITVLADKGKWDETAFVRAIVNHDWPLILVNDLNNTERFSPAVRQAIRQSYYQAEKIGDALLYRPRLASQ
jgi:hypothetical protein